MGFRDDFDYYEPSRFITVHEREPAPEPTGIFDPYGNMIYASEKRVPFGFQPAQHAEEKA